MNVRFGGGPILAVATAAIAVYAVLFASSYDLRVLTVSGIYVILVLGYQFIFGHAGALSLAQGAFFGLGAYVTGILGSQLGWQFTATFPLSILVPAVLAATIALPVLRLDSHYFALATLALGVLGAGDSGHPEPSLLHRRYGRPGPVRRGSRTVRS